MEGFNEILIADTEGPRNLTVANLAHHNNQSGSSQDHQYRPVENSYRYIDPVAQEMNAMNKAVIERVLPMFDAIITRACHGSLYTYQTTPSNDPNASPWKEAGVSGPVFVIRLRPAHESASYEDGPVAGLWRYALMIFNRDGPKYFVLEIVEPSGINMEKNFIFLGGQKWPDEADPYPTNPWLTREAHEQFFGPEEFPEGKMPVWGLWVYAQGSTAEDRDRVMEELLTCAEKARTGRIIQGQTEGQRIARFKRVSAWTRVGMDNPIPPNITDDFKEQLPEQQGYSFYRGQWVDGPLEDAHQVPEGAREPDHDEERAVDLARSWSPSNEDMYQELMERHADIKLNYADRGL